MIVQPFASRRTVVERRTPSTVELLVATLEPPPDEELDELTDTELLDAPELCEEADTPPSSVLTLVSITRPSAV
ncbi:hypothetical protein [Sphingomonas lenta]|uniref:Uncharacterized protein n=1 Tax=Sphingomonas lenta TaxID=1141887 RepID=A0A2A2SC56_9SPHN|nr:hypothetical protein [Sphingomonas lenta]PAX06838.1 hypothetical protein CKY28_12205 [Sphingomonas lenta]